MKLDTKKLTKWIHSNKLEFIDECNEYNYTKIAETMAEEHQLYIDNDGTIPEEVFELVVEVLT